MGIEIIIAIVGGFLIVHTLEYALRKKPVDLYQKLIDDINAYGAAVTIYPPKNGKAEIAIGGGEFKMKPPIRLFTAASHDIAMAQALQNLAETEL